MSDKPVSFTLAGDLGKPASQLIDRISDAIGGIARPWQIVRVAKAEAEAAGIVAKAQAQAEIEVKNLQIRAAKRFVAEESKKQANMEQIIGDALPLLEDKSRPQEVEEDWLTNFFEKCRIVSDKDMQNLWSKLLASEANSPGGFSKRSVNLLADLDKLDAQLFTTLCRFKWVVGTAISNCLPLVLDYRNKFYVESGVNFSLLTHLDSLGLIRFDSSSSFVIKGQPRIVQLSYFDRTLTLGLPNAHDNQLMVGNALFTRSGAELARVAGATPADGAFEHICEVWKGLIVEPATNDATGPNTP